MHIQETPHAMSRAVEIVQPVTPHVLSCEGIDLEARGALGENTPVDRDVAF